MDELVQKITLKVNEARSRSFKAVNFIMVESYWDIGRMIIEEEQKGEARAEYGKELIPLLSKRLTSELGKGFSASNLWNCRLFFQVFPILDTLCRELSWSHYRLLMRVENENARDYYMREANSQNWGVRTLKRQINTHYFDRLLISEKSGPQKVEENDNNLKEVRPKDLLKDPYILEFTGLSQHTDWLEKDLEQGLIDKLQEFLLELGKGFSFVGRQYKISTETKFFYIDLVFYNYLLKCFVLIDLKTGELTHQDIGQMDMYVRLFEDRVKPEGDNPTIGIILCSDKDETIVKYSILEENEQLFASKYKLYIPSAEVLKEEISSIRSTYEGKED